MPRYTFLTIEKEELMDVPGEIIETYTRRPFTSDQFVALVKLEGDVEQDGEVVQDDSEGVEPETIEDLTDVSGVGPATAENLEAEGFNEVDRIRAANLKALLDVDGVGESTAKNLKEYVE